MDKDNIIEFGDLVKDVITDVEGIVVAYLSYFTGCDQIGIELIQNPEEVKDIGTIRWFDIARIEILGKQHVELRKDNKFVREGFGEVDNEKVEEIIQKKEPETPWRRPPGGPSLGPSRTRGN